MKIILVTCVLAALMHQEVFALISASESDFVVDCGATMGGPIRIVYINQDPTNNRVVKMSGLRNLPTCFAQACSSGIFTILDVRTNCTIAQLDPTQPVYEIEIILQEYDGLYLVTDPRFVFRCTYACTGTLTTHVPSSTGLVNLDGTLKIAG